MSAIASLTTRLDAWLPADGPIWVGYSGGLDSSVLLHALCRRAGPDRVRAVHVHHGLDPAADAWQRHCQQQCEHLGCELVVRRVQVAATGEGLEAAARVARYRQFDSLVPAGATLALAHHLDDQLETFLLRLLRGSGLTGLAAMAASVERSGYWLVRPWLDCPRSDLEAYAREAGLDWIEDPSNADDSFDRNYLRQRVFPLLADRWPAYRRTLARSLDHLDSARRDWEAELGAELEHRLAADGALKAVALDDWSDARILALLHLWLRRQGVRAPSTDRLMRVLEEVVRARPDATPRVELGGGSVRRFRTALYWVPEPRPPGPPPDFRVGRQHWRGVGELVVCEAHSGPGRLRLDAAPLAWGLRQGGERLWPAGRAGRRDLKRLLQEYRLPPWLRERVPLLFCADQLVAIAGYCVDRDWAAADGEPGWRLDWVPGLGAPDAQGPWL